MAADALVDVEIRQGRQVVECLESAGIPFRAALWYFAPEHEDWRLMIATPLVRTDGPLKAYRKVLKALAKDSEARLFPFNRIWLVEDDFPLIGSFEKFLNVGRGRHVRFSEDRVQALHIRDAHIYRLNP